jgi:hypothetical protein
MRMPPRVCKFALTVHITVSVAWIGLVLLGVTSIVYPDATSSLGLPGALAAIAWGLLFIAAAERTRDVERPALPGSPDALSRSPQG